MKRAVLALLAALLLCMGLTACRPSPRLAAIAEEKAAGDYTGIVEAAETIDPAGN